MRKSYLAVCDFSGGVANTGKIDRHLSPLTEQADTTVICLAPDHTIDDIAYRAVPSVGFRPVDLLLLFVVALIEGARRDYDGVVSISLIPYGCFALALGRLYGIPAHLAIIGADLDVHARARYGVIVRALLRRFDAISVPGTEHADQLEALGVSSERVTVLTNAIDHETYRPGDVPTEYDFIWVGRFTPEKDPLLFVETIAELHQQGEQPRAVMLGKGPLREEAIEYARTEGVEELIDFPGWVEEPVEYYHRTSVFVLTSERDALPLTMLEAMSTGLACVVPDVGNVSDVAIDGENALLVETRDAPSFATHLLRIERDADLYERISKNARAVGPQYSYEQAENDWLNIRRTMHARNR